MAGLGFIIAIVGLGLLIFIHELGHFVSGKLLGLKVTEFFLGLPVGRPLVKWTRGETSYGIKPVFFGGYVKFPEFLAMSDPDIDQVAAGSPAATAGLRKGDRLVKIDNQAVNNWPHVFDLINERSGRTVEVLAERNGDETVFEVSLGENDGRAWFGAGPASTEPMTIEDLPNTLEGQSLWRKVVVVAAGPLMNMFLAVVLIAGALVVGLAQPTTTIGQVVPGGPAEAAGLKEGDKVVSVDGQKTPEWQNVIAEIQKHPGERVEVVVERNGRQLTFEPKLRDEPEQGLLGIGTKLVRRPQGPVTAVKQGVVFTYQASGLILSFMGRLVTQPGEVVAQLRGPIGVVHETAPMVRQDLTEYVLTLAGISIAIGIFNLLPVPPLDGGRIFVSGLEFIFRRPMPKEFLMLINVAGVSLLLVLMVYVIAADIFRIATPGG
jgi:regulator of sigma E protease